MKIHRSYLAESCLLYTLAYVAYAVTSFGLENSDYFLRARQFAVIAVIAYIVQLVLQRHLFSRENIFPIFIGGAWGLVVPILENLDRQEFHELSSVHDVLAGAYLILFLILLQVLCHGHKLRWIYVVIGWLLTFISVAQIVYFAIYAHPLDDTSVAAIFQTTWRDYLDWLAAYVGTPKAFCILIMLILFGGVMYRHMGKQSAELSPKKKWGTLAMVAILIVYWGGTLVWKTPLGISLVRVHDYLGEEEKFNDNHPRLIQDLVLMNPDGTASRKVPGTILVVIGESACRDEMKAYHEDYLYDDTPWMSSMAGQSGFFIFPHAYACYNQTAIALSYALTESSQYNDKRFAESVSVIDVARIAGYDTYWLTNQGGMSQYDASVTLVAKLSDYLYSPERAETRMAYDEELLPFLKQVDGSKNNFLVVHLMGSHAKYPWRYPEEVARWQGDSPKSEYANTILYTDSILQQLFEYAQKNLNLTAMVYFSDHGENLFKGHNPQSMTFEDVRIPFFIYLSPKYMAAYPERAEQLQAHLNRYFSNDMMYDTISGLIGAMSNHSDERQDLTSPAYAYDRDNVKSFLGTRMVSEDE